MQLSNAIHEKQTLLLLTFASSSTLEPIYICIKIGINNAQLHAGIYLYVTVHAKRSHKSANIFPEISADFALLFPFLPSYKI